MTSRVTQGSYIWNSARCFVTGSSQSSRDSSARIEIAAQVKAFVFEAIPKSVSASTAPGSPTLRTP